MVQIDAPGNQVAVGASDVDSQAITEDAIAAPEDADHPSDMPTGFSGAEEVEDSEAALDGSPPPSWQSERTHRSRQIAMVVAVSITGLLAAVLFFTWFVRNWKEQESTTTAAVETPQDTVAPAEANVTPEASPEAPANSEPEAEVEDPVVEPPVEQEPAQPNAADPNTDGNPNTDSQTPSEIPIPGDLINPIAIDPRSKANAAAEQEAAEEEAPPLALPADLAGLRDLLEVNGPRDLAPTLEAPPSEVDVDIEAAAKNELDPMLDITEPQRINVKADFAIPLALDSAGYRFADLMLLFSQLTSVPIQIDWVSFDLAGIDVHQMVKVPKQQVTSLGSILESICESLGAEVREQEYFVIVTPTDESFAIRQQELTNLDDFGGATDSAVVVLNEFVNGANAKGAAELRVGDGRQEKQFAILAVESLRRMRGLEPKLSNSLLSHWAQASENQSIEWPLLSGGATSPQRSTPISAAGLIRREAQGNNASCVVFWADAIPRKLSPVHILLPKSEKDAGETMQKLMSEFGLQIRQVDANRWWLGSASTYDRANVVVWTQPLGDTADAFRGRMNTVMAGRDEFRITMDPKSDRAIMLLPRYIVRQLPKIEASVAAK